MGIWNLERSLKNMKIKDQNKLSGRYRFKVYKAGTRELIRITPWIKNLIVKNANSGVNIAIKNLLGDFTYTLEITHAKIGTGTTAAADGDTDLEAAVLSDIKVMDADETGLDEATFLFFIADSELPDDDYTEFGLFCGTRLFARSIITPTFSKGANQDVECEYVITNSNS